MMSSVSFRGGFLLQYHSLQEASLGLDLPAAHWSATTLGQEETNIGRLLAHDDRIGIGETAPVYIHDEIAGSEPGERTMNAARELIAWSPRTKRFADGKCQQVTDAQRSRKREGARAADCDGVEVEWNPHADHQAVIFCRIEELPAGGDK
jgi:hypothetical protein